MENFTIGFTTFPIFLTMLYSYYSVHPLIEKVVKLLLRKDPVQRPTASEAAMMMFLLLYAPESLVSFPKPPVVTEDEVMT